MVEKEIFIFGLRRSGNHAIVHWLVGLFQDRHPTIRNDCVFHHFFVNNQPLPLSNIPMAPSFGNTQVISFESQEAMLYDETLLDPTKRKAKKKPIIVHRDPFNWMASTRAISYIYGHKEENFDHLVDLWILYAKKFFIEKPDLAYTVKFNQWKNEEYRRKLAEYIEEPFSDTGLNWIKGPVQGGPGSSFDMATYDGRAQEMALEDRWKGLDNRAKKIFDEKPELRILSKQIFDFCPF